MPTVLFCCAVTWTSPARSADAANLGRGPGASAPVDAIWLDSLDLSLVDQDVSSAQASLSVTGNALSIAGKKYVHGVGAHAASEMSIDLKGIATRFISDVGVDDETKGHGSVIFQIWVDGKKVTDSGIVRGGEPARAIEADLSHAKKLKLVVTDAGDNLDNDHADWAGAIIYLEAGVTERPIATSLGLNEPQLVIASGTPCEPQIHGPRVVGTSPGRPFVFLIPATGQGPLTFSAANLPQGLAVDSKTGIISGTVKCEGRFEATLIVRSPQCAALRPLTIVSGSHKLAQTPPMGWNSWNVWGCSVDDAKIRAAADAMVASGLAAHGFQYINIDDCWQGERDARGVIQTNARFPDMKGLAAYVHSKGMRFGLYSSPGPKTCGGYTGSYQHEVQDARTWAEWGVDYVKYDWCSYGEIAGKDPGIPALQKPYRELRAALDDCSRDIVLSFCQYGMGDVWKWGSQVGGNLWRTGGDINDSWASLDRIGFSQDKSAPYAEPGHWNDPDMLVVGKVGWGPTLHATHLTRNEQITHITLWSLLAAPLLIGCDMSDMNKLTLDLLSNDEVLDVDQDPLGKAATLKARDGETQVWSRPLFDHTLAVGLFNRGRKTATVETRWSDLGLTGPQPIRDLWQHKDLGTFSGEFAVDVPRHGARLLRIGQPQCRP